MTDDSNCLKCNALAAEVVRLQEEKEMKDTDPRVVDTQYAAPLATAAENKLVPREEWVRRFVQRLIDVAGVTPQQALAEVEGGGFEYLSEYYEDDPEGSADMAMSYWND